MKTRQTKRTVRWTVLAESVQGATHRRAGQPNQDSTAVSPSEGSGLPLLLAVSDGHGSSRSFRSDRGSRFAVETAIEETGRFVADLPDGAATVKQVAEERLPAAIARAWEQKVLQDLAEHPLSPEEEAKVGAGAGAGALQALRENPTLAYGATLMAAVATGSFLLLLQIGDGDIVTVSPAGCADRPLKTDPRIFAGETTSLCLPDAAQSFAVAYRRLDRNRPALVLLSTDGYSNSYVDDAGFLSVGADLLTMIREEGLESVRRELPEWLDEVSRLGSGDDVSLGVLCLL